jgi:REP element-mobilizing transposase RayT
MQILGRLYVRWINRELKRSGTLWEDRYKISLVDAEDYLLGCMRYIELNPVRARGGDRRSRGTNVPEIAPSEGLWKRDSARVAHV